jgi:hypothetical protein
MRTTLFTRGRRLLRAFDAYTLEVCNPPTSYRPGYPAGRRPA